MKKELIVLGTGSALLLFTASGFAAGNETAPNGKPFVAINDQIVEVNGAISSLQYQIDELVARVDTIEERVGANEDAITMLPGAGRGT